MNINKFVNRVLKDPAFAAKVRKMAEKASKGGADHVAAAAFNRMLAENVADLDSLELVNKLDSSITVTSIHHKIMALLIKNLPQSKKKMAKKAAKKKKATPTAAKKASKSKPR